MLQFKKMSHDSCKAALASDWLAFLSIMARTKILPRKGEKGKPKKVKTMAEIHVQLEEPPALAELQCQGWRPLQPQVRWRGGEWRQRGWRRWGDHWSHCQPNSWPRWLWRLGHLCWGEELATKKLQLTVAGMAPKKEFLQVRKVKKTQRYQQGMVALCETS